VSAENFPGLGLGLSLVQELLAVHGGRLHFQSELDQGTTVTFVLPLAPAEVRT
jgi:signal transduction histidine kinase